MTTIDSVKLVIGDYSVIEDEKLLEEMIQKFDEDASYKDAYLVTKSGTFYLVLEYNDYTRVVNDSFDEGISDEDAYGETIENEIGDFFEDWSEYDDRFYTMFKPLFVDIYQTINEYGLNKDEFLNYFYKKNGDGIDYDVVEYFKYCLDRGEITRFIQGNY
jgi:hypothetical protein